MDIIITAKEFAQNEYVKNDPKHQWGHIEEVMQRAMEIVTVLEKKDIPVDKEALQLAIIFHDIDYESYETHVDASMSVAKEFLEQHNYPEERIAKVVNIMRDHSTPHRKKFGDAQLIEGKIIYDADKSIYLTPGTRQTN